MATDVEKLVVSLEASITKYERTMNKALGVTNTTMKKIEKSQATAMQRINAGWSDMQRNIATAFAVAASARGVVTLIDTATRIENSLKVVGLAGEELERVYDALYASAQRNMAPLETLTTLYSRLGLAQKELGVTNEELLNFTDKVALALRVQGTTAQEARGALIQLSQAMGSGIVRAEEFNSVVEGAPSILRAAAVGLKEANGSVAQLRKLVIDGKVTSEAFFRAFEAGAYILEDQVASAQVTVQQQFVRLQNILIDVAREFNEGTRASELLGDGIANLAEIVQQFGQFVQMAIGPVQELVGWFNQATGAANGFANELARITGLEGAGAALATGINDLQVPGLTAGSSAYSRVLSQTFELVGNTPEDEALAAALAGRAQPEPLKVTVTADRPSPVSLSDFKAPSGKGSGGGKKSSGDRYADSIADFERRITMLNQETELMRTLNPLINDYGYSKERLKAIQELENAAAKAGIEITEGQRAKIEELAGAYALATSEAARLAEAQDMARQSFDDLNSAARSALDGLVDGFLEGKDAGEVLNSVVKDLIKNVAKIGINMMLGGLFPGGNILGGLFGGMGFATGTANTGGRRGEPRGIVHGQEAVIPLPSGGKVPVVVKQPAAAQGVPQQLTVHVVSDDEKFSAYVTDGAGKVVRGAAPSIIKTSVNAAPMATADRQLRYA